MKNPYDSDIAQKTIVAYYTPGGDGSELRHLCELREGYRRALSDLAPRLEAADALAEAVRLTEDYLDHIGTCEAKWACSDCGIKRSRAYDARVKALGVYDATKKDPHD